MMFYYFYILGAIIIGYIFGCFLTAVIVAKKYTGKDISEIGSGNPGMANVMARIGKKQGFMVLAGDILKTVFAMVITWLLFKNNLTQHEAFLYSGFGCLLGHNFPAQRKFKGGKGVTVTCTWIILLLPVTGIISAVAGGLITVMTGLLPLGAVLITLFFIPFSYIKLGNQAAIIMTISFIIMLYRHFPGFIRGFKDQEKREFKRQRSVKAVIGTVAVIICVIICMAFECILLL